MDIFHIFMNNWTFVVLVIFLNLLFYRSWEERTFFPSMINLAVFYTPYFGVGIHCYKTSCIPRSLFVLPGIPVIFEINILILQTPPKSFYEILPYAHPRWSILILEPASKKGSVYPGLVKWLPWSLFMISGVEPPSAFLQVSKTNLISRVSSISHVRTYREYQSIMAVR